MKNKLLAGFMLLTTIVLIASCASTRKYGCPMAQVSSHATVG